MDPPALASRLFTRTMSGNSWVCLKTGGLVLNTIDLEYKWHPTYSLKILPVVKTNHLDRRVPTEEIREPPTVPWLNLMETTASLVNVCLDHDGAR